MEHYIQARMKVSTDSVLKKHFDLEEGQALMMDEMSVAEQAKAMKEKLTDAEKDKVDEYRH